MDNDQVMGILASNHVFTKEMDANMTELIVQPGEVVYIPDIGISVKMTPTVSCNECALYDKYGCGWIITADVHNICGFTLYGVDQK